MELFIQITLVSLFGAVVILALKIADLAEALRIHRQFVQDNFARDTYKFDSGYMAPGEVPLYNVVGLIIDKMGLKLQSKPKRAKLVRNKDGLL